MNKKVVDLINAQKNIDLEVLSNNEYIINCFNEDLNSMDINITQDNNSILIINFFAITNKDINVNIHCLIKGNNNKCVINFNTIAQKDFSQINVTVKANKNTECNEIIENLKGINEEGSVSFMPILEIDTNEVDASHFVTVGGYDKNKLFYLESKGLDKKSAYKLLKNNFKYGLFSKNFINKLNERGKVNE